MEPQYKLTEDMSSKQMAEIIYNHFEVLQSCTILGWETGELEINGLTSRRQEIIAKGDEVLKELERLDSLENIRPMGKKMTRKRKKLPNTIGGYVAHKIFKYTKRPIDGHIKVDIWRIQ